MNEQIVSLNGEWTLYYSPETPELGDTPDALRAAGQCIPAIVPGNVELDLERAGIEPDPFWADNLYRFRKYEFYSWQFERRFTAPARGGSRWKLVFEGLNNFADIYVNGTKVGDSRNSFIEHEFDVTDALNYGGDNLITVRIRSAINEARRYDYPAMLRSDEYTRLRMPPSSFGWDIMGRFLSAGMWRGVSLREVKPTRITDLYYSTVSIGANGSARILARYRWETDDAMLIGYTMRFEGRCADSSFVCEAPAYFISGTFDFHLPDAKLWWPRGYGEQPLYDVKLCLIKDGAVLDERCGRMGVRVLRLDQVIEPGDAGEFRISANGCPILCKGSNWVPMDALHSRDAERVPAAVALLCDAGCNIVRCWGGNVYEDHAFFDLCDEGGIMVWQDFAMACAVYPPDPEFADEIEREAASVVRKLRNHPSILLWAGDNEVDEGIAGLDIPTYSNRYNSLTREVLPRVVRMHDPYRVFLPSSPYIPEGTVRYATPEQHNWGARAYFKDDFYKHSTAHFISECGYHGCPAVSSLRRYIPQERMNSWLNDPIWDAHNTDYLPHGARGYNRIQLMQDQVEILFGHVPQDVDTFARLSQISQAEAKKFFIERTRLKKWRRTGVIWWNMIDGWPQISDAVVDYYYAKKLAYYYIKRVQQPIAVLMDELVGWEHEVVLANDSRESRMVRYRVTDGDTGAVYMEGEKLSPANENVALGSIRELAGAQKLYLITWEVDGVQFGNHYISGYPAYDAQRMLAWVDRIAALPQPFDWQL